MGWWPSIFGGDKSADPLNQLDPKLREFLEKESPKHSQATGPTSTTTPQDGRIRAAVAASSSQGGEEKPVPRESLYQDGRYAHLWKNYRPQAEVEAEAMTDHDRLMGVLEGFQERKAQITKVAMENCAESQEAWINCMKHGSWEDQLQMCRHQVRAFEKCYTMQSVRTGARRVHFLRIVERQLTNELLQRFLRALGYGSVTGRPQAVDDDIQMHADALYQRVLRHEEAVKEAKENGTPVPVFDPSIPRVSPATVQPSEEVQQQWKEKLDELPESERAAEEAALRADLQAKSDVAKSMREFYEAKFKKTKDDDPNANNQEKSVGETLVSLLTGR